MYYNLYKSIHNIDVSTYIFNVLTANPTNPTTLCQSDHFINPDIENPKSVLPGGQCSATISGFLAPVEPVLAS